jgi:hypothetical protein
MVNSLSGMKVREREETLGYRAMLHCNMKLQVEAQNP